MSILFSQITLDDINDTEDGEKQRMNRQIAYKEFKERLNVIRTCLCLKPENKKDRRCIERTAALFVFGIEEVFGDTENNLLRWMRGESCYFTHPNTKRTIEIAIKDNPEAIYHFLAYVKALKDGKLRNDTLAYTAYILCLGKERY